MQLERWPRMRSIWWLWSKFGADFIHLVVEWFGVWTPFSLKMLKDHTTPWSGMPPKLARKNLFQQLSVSLWQSNATTIPSSLRPRMYPQYSSR